MPTMIIQRQRTLSTIKTSKSTTKIHSNYTK